MVMIIVMVVTVIEFDVHLFNFIATLFIQHTNLLFFFKTWHKVLAFYVLDLPVVLPVDLSNLHISFSCIKGIIIVMTVVIFFIAIIVAIIFSFVTIIFVATGFILCKCRSK